MNCVLKGEDISDDSDGESGSSTEDTSSPDIDTVSVKSYLFSFLLMFRYFLVSILYPSTSLRKSEVVVCLVCVSSLFSLRTKPK